MNKLFTKIAGFALGLAMAAGVGIGVSSTKVEEVKAASQQWELITSAPSDWSGEYILCNGTSGTVKYLDGSEFSSGSASGNDVVVTDGKITADVDDAITIAKSSTSGKYTVKINGLFVGKDANSNGFDVGETWTSKLDNSISYESNKVKIAGNGGRTLTWFGNNSNFRYYSSTNNCSQLFKKVSSAKLVSITGLEGSLQAYQGDSFWDLTTLTPKGTLSDDTTKEVDISDYVELKTDDVPGTELGSKKVTVQVIDLLKTVASKSFDVDGEVIAIPPVPVTHTMADCYTVAKGTKVKFNGVYMGAYGTNPYNGIFFADGEYGIMVFGTSSVPSDWEVGKTVLAISGQTDYYNGLVQIKTASFEVTSATVAVPVVYEFTGAETTPVALSRKTSLSGKVTALKNAFESDKDTTVTIDLGGEKSASIFLKKGVFTNAQLAEFKAGFVVNNEVTVTGFLNYYKSGQTIDTAYTPSAFQIIVPTLVKVGTYTANDYALDFISATDAVCSTPFGEDGHLTGLLAIWTELNTKYSALKDAEKVAFANPDTTDTDIKAAIARYDYICGKYNAGGIVLTEFVEGHIVPTLSLAFTRDYKVQTNTPMIIVICCAVASVTALGILIVIKRRKSSVK